MTDYLNPHRIYPDDISRRIDIAPGFDSVRPAVKESLTTALDENGLARCGCGGEPKMLDIKRPYADKGFWVECQGCGITIGPCDSPTIAIIAFNQAMGVRGADE